MAITTIKATNEGSSKHACGWRLFVLEVNQFVDSAKQIRAKVFSDKRNESAEKRSVCILWQAGHLGKARRIFAKCAQKRESGCNALRRRIFAAFAGSGRKRKGCDDNRGEGDEDQEAKHQPGQLTKSLEVAQKRFLGHCPGAQVLAGHSPCRCHCYCARRRRRWDARVVANIYLYRLQSCCQRILRRAELEVSSLKCLLCRETNGFGIAGIRGEIKNTRPPSTTGWLAGAFLHSLTSSKSSGDKCVR